MKKAAFIIGYAGSILALIFSLLMIYTVPLGLAEEALDDLKDEIGNEHVLAFNEMALAAQQNPITDYSERSLKAYARNVAQNSTVINDQLVYDNTVEFVYDVGYSGMVSMILVGISIVFALIAFIGSLITRRSPVGGGILMIVAALATVLVAIYTDTFMPMIFATVLLAIAGITAFASRPKAFVQPMAAQPMYVPERPLVSYDPPRDPYNQPVPQFPVAESESDSDTQDSVPFPNDAEVLAQSGDAQDDIIE